uniref:Uncharacterized protein n=1 Tax=Oncorhynchus kisutch TaxID=8019 RepID=A0A8C7J310_ONCKI
MIGRALLEGYLIISLTKAKDSLRDQSLSRSYGSDLPTSLTYIVLTCQRLSTLETYLHPLPRIFKGQRELTGCRRNRNGPSLGSIPFQGVLPFTKKIKLSPGLPPASPGSVAFPQWTPRGARLRQSVDILKFILCLCSLTNSTRNTKCCSHLHVYELWKAN